ncbi:MAG: hypothetical protein Q8O70_09020, partial [Burkholderiales bacterium]|nr:hypothetical protein [Burkholderiales bacterium]
MGRFAQHLRQIDIVERKHFADDIENAVGQNRAHLFQLLQESGEDFSFNDVLAFLRLCRNEIERVTVALLSDAVNAAKPLFQARGVPGKVVVNHQPAELKVDAFTRCFGGDANLARSVEILLGALALVGVHPAVNLRHGVAPFAEMLAQVFQRVAVLGENEQLAPSVGQFLELGAPETFVQCG